MKRYLFVMCYKHPVDETPSFIHYFVRAKSREDAYDVGNKKLWEAHPELKGHGINDYVVLLEGK